MQTALLDLKKLIQDGVFLLDVPNGDLTAISRTNVFRALEKILILFILEIISQSLLDSNYLDDATNAQKIFNIIGLPHFHHHEKRSAIKTASSVSLSRQGLPKSPSFVMNNPTRLGLIIFVLKWILLFFY